VKILARYATDFFSLKELIQNGCDAGASHIQILLTPKSSAGKQCTFSHLFVSDVTTEQAVIFQLFASTLPLNSKLLSSNEHLAMH
jgi:hypothetical protein